MMRYVITARLRRRSVDAVRQILREGPPFDLEGTPLESHAVFVGRDELVFLFEGPQAEETVQSLLENFKVAGRAGRIAAHFKGAPRIPDEVFGWSRAPRLEGVSFGPEPGPGDSEGG